MLSINVPVYNYVVCDLVEQLIDQAEKLNIGYEIRVYDDGSEPGYKALNQKIADYEKVVYRELKQNIGRAAIRNKMGFESRFEYLLFIDADSMPVSENYLKNFIENAKPNIVLCGGTAYQKEKPAEPEKFLRWYYGSKREAISAETRNKKKGFIITSNNFLIAKTVFTRVHFRENINKYGHEDTLLGYDLFCNGIAIFHIDNPVEHTGLENSVIFLQKTRTALASLHEISATMLHGDTAFAMQVKFLARYSGVTRVLPVVFLKLFFKLFSGFIEKKLTGTNPNLFLFDLYKLGYYSTLKRGGG